MKIGRDGWVLAGMIAVPVLLLALYAGAYCWIARAEQGQAFSRSFRAVRYPQSKWMDFKAFFRPIHRLDRRLRPGYWGPNFLND